MAHSISYGLPLCQNTEIEQTNPSSRSKHNHFTLNQEFDQKVSAATLIQSLYRGHKARLIVKQLRLVKSITIIDAKDCNMEWHDVWNAIETIANKELKDEEGLVSASSYVKEEYFKNIPIEPDLASPELILLAKAGNDIVGFIITAKKEINDEEEAGLWSLPADTGYIAYLAVDSTSKRGGIGTKLMLAAMQKTKELGKRYLTLEYIAKGVKVDPNRGQAKIEFYNSFTTRFGIPMQEKGNVIVDRQLHVHPYYDLKEIHFSLI